MSASGKFRLKLVLISNRKKSGKLFELIYDGNGVILQHYRLNNYRKKKKIIIIIYTEKFVGTRIYNRNKIGI